MAKPIKNERSYNPDIDSDPDEVLAAELAKIYAEPVKKLRRKGADPTREHYVDKEEFFKEMCAWKKEYLEAKKKDLPKPPIGNSIGEKILLIATRVSFMPKFMNYPFREEMISDGIETCLLYIHNFNPKKSQNPFAYFTTIVYYSFLRRIKLEKKELATKFKYVEEHLSGDVLDGDVGKDTFGSDYSDANRREFLHNYEQSRIKKKKKRQKKTVLDWLTGS